jgi:hypothetical protein
MSYPVFASGDVLNASDMNAVGLWLIKSQTVGSAVASVTVTDAFSSTYDNYKIIMSGGVGSTTIDFSLRLGAAAANYYGALVYCNYSSSTANAIGTNAGTNCTYIGGADGSFAQVDIEINAPNLAKATTVQGPFQNNAAFGHSAYRLADTTQYTAFTIFCNLGTITGGTITVYGYRKA